MINAIAELGRYVKDNNRDMTDFDIWLEDAYDGGNYNIVFFIVLKRIVTSPGWRYQKIDIHENGEHLKNKLVYKRGTSRGTDKTPTAKVAKSITGAFEQKILAWFSSNKDAVFLQSSEKDSLDAIYNALQKDKERIIDDLERRQQSVVANGIVLSLQFIDGSSTHYIGDLPFIAGFIVEESKTAYKYSKTFKKHSFSTDKTCAVCKDLKKEVFGYFTSLGFYTVDKPGMVTGGFQQDQSWKNYPVCLDCALDIETGIKEKEKYFDFNFYGCRYYLIPKIIHEAGRLDIMEAIKDYRSNQRVSDAEKRHVLNPEEDVLWLLKDFQNHAQFTLLFYDKPQKGVFRIVENIEAVLPSRIKRLYDVKTLIDDLFIFREPEKEGERIFRYSFAVPRLFFPRDNIRGNHDKDFLQIVHKIFSGIPVRYDFLLSRIMRAVRHRFSNNEYEWFQTLNGFMMLLYFQKLGLINHLKGAQVMTIAYYGSFEIKKEDDYDARVDAFFNQFDAFFTTHAQKAIFLTGVLAKLLLKVQQAKRDATPFRSQLKGLKMDGSDIQGLLPKIEDKLAQYDNHAYTKLMTLISKIFLAAGDHRQWNLTIDEMNYVFVLGMNLCDYFKIKNEK